MKIENIISSVKAIFNGADERNWEKVEQSFTDEVLLDYASISGEKPATLSPSEITSLWKALLRGFQSTHHQTGNFSVVINGNTAAVKNHGLALHYLPNESNNDIWVVSGTYDFSLAKQSNGKWAVDKMKFNLQQQAGNLQLPMMAQQKVKEKAKFNPGTISAQSKEVVEKFFASLEKMDIHEFLSVWNDDGKQMMPFSPGDFPKQLEGKKAIYDQYKALPVNYASMKFLKKMFATNDPNTLIVQFDGIIPLKGGGEYNNIYIGVFKINNQKIQEYTEYFDPLILQQYLDKNAAENNNGARKKVEFKSEGLVMAGTLHLPPGFKEDEIYKAVIVTGSWTTVKEQMPYLYADQLAEQQYIALSFDFRNYGESEGQPRNYEVPELKAEDIKNAADYLQSLSFVDKNNIGGLAICASAGYMAEATIKGAGIKVITFVAPWLHDHKSVAGLYGGEKEVNKKIAEALEAKKNFAESGKVDYVPATSTTDSAAAMFGSFDYYLDPNRGGIKEWANQFAVMAWQGWLQYEPIPYAEKLLIPVRIIHSKKAACRREQHSFTTN